MHPNGPRPCGAASGKIPYRCKAQRCGQEYPFETPAPSNIRPFVPGDSIPLPLLQPANVAPPILAATTLCNASYRQRPLQTTLNPAAPRQCATRAADPGGSSQCAQLRASSFNAFTLLKALPEVQACECCSHALQTRPSPHHPAALPLTAQSLAGAECRARTCQPCRPTAAAALPRSGSAAPRPAPRWAPPP